MELEANPEFVKAKLYLQSIRSDKYSLYDHLAAVIKRILEQRPKSGLAQFELLSFAVKKGRQLPYQFRTVINDEPGASRAYKIAQNEKQLFEFDDEEEPNENLPDFAAWEYLIDKSCVGINKTECFKIWLALRRLLKANPDLAEVRFWGKIHTATNPYYLLEVGANETSQELAGPWDKPEMEADVVEIGHNQEPKNFHCLFPLND
ncbi:hypothetical protein Ciccas_010087 [Cichlidogyrus casuarinus]|uniref:Uncharacterized protein n=1 Tax=Cichlidogyrus casuarinus TaxID=1844966 RepID=A0ABD2PWP6_9PLAT